MGVLKMELRCQVPSPLSHMGLAEVERGSPPPITCSSPPTVLLASRYSPTRSPAGCFPVGGQPLRERRRPKCLLGEGPRALAAWGLCLYCSPGRAEATWFPWLRTTLPTVFAPSVFPGAVRHILLTLVSLLQGPVLNSCDPREGPA